MMLDFVRHPRRTIERKIQQPEHVEGGHQRRPVTDEPEVVIGIAFLCSRLPQDFVFREESGEGENSGDREYCDQHRPMSSWDALAEVAHVAHILLAAHGVNYRARPEEEKRFEESVGENMEHACGKSSDAES